MIRVAICGVRGRMGRQVVETVMRDPELVFVGGLVRRGQTHIRDAVRFEECRTEAGLTISENLNDLLEMCDVVVDFSSPASSMRNLTSCSRYGKAMVIGSTGFASEDLSLVRDLALNIPVVCSPNMSIGVNVISRMLQEVAGVLGDDFEVDILETHHRMKKDNPSGTALHLGEVLAEASGRSLNSVASEFRKDSITLRSEKETGMHVVRGGDIIGDHTVYFIGKGERIEITHRAHSRDMFSQGAVKAAKSLINREPGLYSMKDVLGLN